MAETAGAPGAQLRQSRLQVPGTSAAMTLIEFKNIERKSLSHRVQDPGMSMLQLMVRDLDGLLKKLKTGRCRHHGARGRSGDPGHAAPGRRARSE